MGISTHGRTVHTQIQLQTTVAVSTYYNIAGVHTNIDIYFSLFIHRYNDTGFDPVIIKLFL